MTLPVGSESLQAGGHIGHPGSATYKYLRCYGGGGHGGGRSCLERIIFRLGNSDTLRIFIKFKFHSRCVALEYQQNNFSQFSQNKVLSLNLPQMTLAEVHSTYLVLTQLKMVHKTVLKRNGLD